MRYLFPLVFLNETVRDVLLLVINFFLTFERVLFPEHHFKHLHQAFSDVTLHIPKLFVALVLEYLGEESNLVVLHQVSLDSLNDGACPLDDKSLEAILLIEVSVHILFHGLDSEPRLSALLVILFFLTVDIIYYFFKLFQWNNLGSWCRLIVSDFGDVSHSGWILNRHRLESLLLVLEILTRAAHVLCWLERYGRRDGLDQHRLLLLLLSCLLQLRLKLSNPQIFELIFFAKSFNIDLQLSYLISLLLHDSSILLLYKIGLLGVNLMFEFHLSLHHGL